MLDGSQRFTGIWFTEKLNFLRVILIIKKFSHGIFHFTHIHWEINFIQHSFFISHSRSLSLQIRQTALRLVRRIFDYIHFIYAYNSYVLTQPPPYHRTLIALSLSLLCKSRVKKNLETQRERPWHWKLFSHKNQPPLPWMAVIQSEIVDCVH